MASSQYSSLSISNLSGRRCPAKAAGGSVAHGGRRQVFNSGCLFRHLDCCCLGRQHGYAIGRVGGRPLLQRYGWLVKLTPARLARLESLFRRKGSIIVVGARFVVLLRQLNGLVAGSVAMPWRRFVAANVLGAALWTAAWVLGPYFPWRVLRSAGPLAETLNDGRSRSCRERLELEWRLHVNELTCSHVLNGESLTLGTLQQCRFRPKRKFIHQQSNTSP